MLKNICTIYPVRKILIKFLIINLRGKYEEMLRNPTNVCSHKKTHITIVLYMKIGLLERKIRGFGPIPREEYSSRGIFLVRNWAKSSRKYFLTRNHILARNIPWRNIPCEKIYREVFSHSSYFPCEDSNFVRNI